VSLDHLLLSWYPSQPSLSLSTNLSDERAVRGAHFDDDLLRLQPVVEEHLPNVSNTADGVYDTADGVSNTADGVYATADGVSNAADGVSNTADGVSNTSDGVSNTADGVSNTARTSKMSFYGCSP